MSCSGNLTYLCPVWSSVFRKKAFGQASFGENSKCLEINIEYILFKNTLFTNKINIFLSKKFLIILWTFIVLAFELNVCISVMKERERGRERWRDNLLR